MSYRVRCPICRLTAEARAFGTPEAHTAPCGHNCVGGGAASGHPYTCDCLPAGHTAPRKVYIPAIRSLEWRDLPAPRYFLPPR